MFSKNLAIILALSCLGATPVFAAGIDAHDADTNGGHVATPDEKDKSQDKAVTRDQGTDQKDEAAKIAADRDGSQKSAAGQKGFDALAAQIKAAKSGSVEDKHLAIVSAFLGVRAMFPHLDTTKGSKDEAATEALMNVNPANGKLFLDNVSRLHDALKDMASELQGDELTRAEKMIRGFRDLLIGEGTRSSTASADTLPEAMKAYVRSIASDNWSEIEHRAGVIMNADKTITVREAKLRATESILQDKHPEMDEKTRADLAKQIVDSQNGRAACA